MKYVYLQDNVVQEVIPEFSPSFPNIPISKSYPSKFLAGCVTVANDVDVPLGYIYENGGFVPPPPPEPLPEPDPQPDPEPIPPTQAELLDSRVTDCENALIELAGIIAGGA